MKLETKRFFISVKAAEDGTIEGYGSTYGNVDFGKDVVVPGAFAKCIEQMKASGRNCKMLWQHKTDMPIGVWTEITESEKGLYLKGNLLLDTQMGREAYALLKAGAIDGLSIGYGVKNYSIDTKTGIRFLKELDLYEVSLVTFPMNEKATVTSVKSASGDIDAAVQLLNQACALCGSGMEMTQEMCAAVCQMIEAAVAMLDEPEHGDGESEDMSADMTERQLEKRLRDVGLSQRDAKAVIAGGYKALLKHRDGGAEELNEAAANAERIAGLLAKFKA
jgi:HK97 family phage prohead protease